MFPRIIESIIDGIIELVVGSILADGCFDQYSKGRYKIGASSMGLKAGDVADELLSSSSGGISQLREQLQSLVEKPLGMNHVRDFFFSWMT